MFVALLSVYDTYPVGLRYIASSLEQAGHQVVLAKLKPPFEDSLMRFMGGKRPAVIGLTCYTPGFPGVVELAKVSRKMFPDVKIVLGNIHATVFYRAILERYPFIDHIILGEGEIPMRELLECFQGERAIDSVHSLAYRTAEGCVSTTNRSDLNACLDVFSDYAGSSVPRELFFSDYRKTPNLFRAGGIERFAYILSSRGCCYRCDYCPEHIMSFGRWRADPPKKVVDSIERIMRDHQISGFIFADPLFSFDKERVLQICREILGRGLKIHWAFQTHPNCIDEEIVEAAHKAGCVSFNVGIDCMNDNLMRKYRHVSIDWGRLRQVASAAKLLGMSVRFNVITGWPESTWADWWESSRLLWRLRPTHIAFFSLSVSPGSKMSSEMNKDCLLEEYWQDRDRLPRLFAFQTKGLGGLVLGWFFLKLEQFFLTVAFLASCRSWRVFCYFILFHIDGAASEGVAALRNMMWKSSKFLGIRIVKRDAGEC